MILLDVDYGLVIGIGISIAVVIIRDQCFQIRNLISYKDSSFVDKDLILNNSDSVTEHVNVKIFKIQRPIYFVNCERFQHQLYEKYGFSPLCKQALKRNESVFCNDSDKLIELNQIIGQSSVSPAKQATTPIFSAHPDIILDFSGVNYIDTNGVKVLKNIIEDFKKIGIFVYICEPQGMNSNNIFNIFNDFCLNSIVADSLIEILYHMNLLSQLDEHIFVTINEACLFSANSRSKLNFKIFIFSLS